MLILETFWTQLDGCIWWFQLLFEQRSSIIIFLSCQEKKLGQQSWTKLLLCSDCNIQALYRSWKIEFLRTQKCKAWTIISNFSLKTNLKLVLRIWNRNKVDKFNEFGNFSGPSLQFLLVLCKQVKIGFELDHESAILNADSTLTF